MAVVYSALKVFGFPEHARAPGAVPAAPLHVRIKPVNACNERCWYCAYRLDDLSLGSGMDLHHRIPPAKMAEIVDDLIALEVKAVTFSGGGEPLIYGPLAETVVRLAGGGIKIGCLTNGVALRGDVAAALAEHATWVRVSIDAADRAAYAQSRHVPESFFDQVLGNVEAFVAASRGCSVGFSYIVNRDNAASIVDFCKLAACAGARHVKLSACVVSNDAAENNRYHEPIAAIVREQIDAARGLQTAGFEILDHYHALPERFVRPYTACPMLEYLTVIGADCAVYTCQDKAYTESGLLGSIAERTFRDFWFSPENAARIRGWNAAENCRHHCVSHAKNLLLTEFRALDPEHAVFV
jgi:sulfatase maturation enzyme AslB (radical SAM superfamily)